MDLTLQIGEGILFPNALNDAVNAVKPLATSNLVNVDGSSDGIELELEIAEGIAVGDAIVDVIAAFSAVSTSTIASVDTTNNEVDQIFVPISDSSDSSDSE